MTTYCSDPADSPPAQADVDALEAVRRTLSESLPGLLARAVEGYRQYAAGQPPSDPKGFVAYQAGCRAALSHIHLVVRLARWAEPNGEDHSSGMPDDQVERLLREAETALREETMYED